jgi:hypothetical protein
LKMKVSPVIEYLPVSPVAPPNRTTLYLFTIVMVCPNLAYGTFLGMSKTSCAWFGSFSLLMLFPTSGALPCPSTLAALFLLSYESFAADMCASTAPLFWPIVTVSWGFCPLMTLLPVIPSIYPL